MGYPGFDPAPLLRQLELTVTPADDHIRFTADRRGFHGPSDREIAAEIGVHVRTIQRWRHGGTVRTTDADRIACELGLFVTMLWPDYYNRVKC